VERVIVILMGVAGSGKSEVGARLARRLGWNFLEGDAFHPGKNLAKMAAGTPLGDDDRAPFYASLRSRLLDAATANENLILACSALRAKYRALLNVSGQVRFAYLRVSPELLRERLEGREDHFFKSVLLDSQLEAFEEPLEVNAMIVDVQAADTPEELAVRLETALLSRAAIHAVRP
jgi:gluconokinase